MRILVLSHSFNSLTQRLWCELIERGHALSLELDISAEVTREAVRLHAPDIVLAPFLKRRIPEDVWRSVPCLVVHPGIPGDRGPASLDWAILSGQTDWGVTVLEANNEFDAGRVWAAAGFRLREASKASHYRHEVAEAATEAVVAALDRRAAGTPPADALPGVPRGSWHPPLTQADRRIDWHCDPTAVVLRKLRAADSEPGVLDDLPGGPAHLFDPRAALASDLSALPAPPGRWIGRRFGALLRATVDGAVWIGHARSPVAESFKLPAVQVAPSASALPEVAGDDEIVYAEAGAVGYLSFEFYNGAMATAQCERLRAALHAARTRPTRVLVLLGGTDFWSNGLHLGVIEAAASPADESWRNIHALDDVTEAVLDTEDRLVVAAMQGNAGAGGVFLGLAADELWVRPGIVLNPHYRNMGNLYGSEFWTYTLPRRVGAQAAARVMAEREPLLGAAAVRTGLADACFGTDRASFLAEVRERAAALAADPALPLRLAAKRQRLAREQDERPRQAYRAAELEQMRKSFYGFDTSYHIARHRFVHKAPLSWTPRHLARHRQPAAGLRGPA